MSTQTFDARLNTLSAILTKSADQKAVDHAIQAAKGDWAAAFASLKGKLPDETIQKLTLAQSLADWSGDNVTLVKNLAATSGVTSLRDVAFTMNTSKLAALIEPADVPADTPGANAAEKTKNFAVSLQHKLFTAEPTAVLHRMVREAEIPISDTNVRSGVTGVLSNLPDFNIRTTSVYTAFKQTDAFKGIAAENRTAVAEQLKTLQRVQAISPVPEAVPVLMKANLTSAFSVAQIPESTFLKAYTPTLGEDTARQVYTASVNAHVRNEHALMTVRETMRGSGMAILDGSEKREERMKRLQDATDKAGVPLNLESLFGNIDYCECDDCLSVYSPASYFVELLQYLRNNDLQPGKQRLDPKDISNTPLEKLFRRRPDLGCLELTCENTFTVLPYVDLANEVMESFVVHLDKYHTDINNPKQATLQVFNVIDETTNELLAQPQHVNYQAYCILKSAVYPFTLPYHQPIDVIRIWLKYFKTSRWEVLDTFRTATETVDSVALTADQLAQLTKLHRVVQDRAADAEFLGLTQEEYIILTKEAFWPKEYFDLTLQKSHTDDEYREKIGVKPVPEYYGYATEADMLSSDETAKLGLTFVKKQFLPRAGIKYPDLVDLLKTRFINPAFPQGEALTLMESLRFSYRFLQTLVDTSSSDPKVRFSKLIGFLDAAQPLVPLIDALLHPDPCHQQIPECCTQKCDFSNWVYCYFERIGKLIVLESGEGPQLSIDGQLFTTHLIGTLRKDGTVVDKDGTLIGQVSLTGQLVWTDGTAFDAKFGDELLIKDPSGKTIGFVHANGISGLREDRVGWLPARDTCDLDKVRLIHLDGTGVTADEYDRMQRFLRLWRKMGWTMDQTDQALVGLSLTPDGSPVADAAGESHFVGFDAFKDDCAKASDGATGEGCCGDGAGDGNCPDIPPAPQDISIGFIHQLVAVRKLLDLTGLPLEKLLIFWAAISTVGEKSLYVRLFLKHNIVGIDKVFQSDKNGNFLSKPEKMSDHMPVVMAALKLKAEDIAAIVAFRTLSDSLSLLNVSTLYRHALLAKILHVPVSSLPEVIGLLGDPFSSADAAVSLLKDWGEMEDAGFSFAQLNYVVRDRDDAKRPLAPKPKTILVTAKTIYDGLNAIDRDHADIPEEKKNDVTDDVIRAKGGLIFEASAVEQIIGLLNGTSVYTTNAPAGLTIDVPASLAEKVKYESAKAPDPPAGAVHLTGILTDAEVTLAKTLSPLPKWAEAIDRAGKQARHFFNDVLFGIFPAPADAAQLLAPDVNLPPDPANPAATDANTAPVKRFYFIKGFLPFLRQKLAHKLVVETLAGVIGLANDVTDILLSEILVTGASKDAAIDALQKIHNQPAGPASGWKGDLIPTSSDSFVFVATSDTQPSPLLLNGVSVPFSYQQDDPNNVWWTDPVPLKAAVIYKLETGVFPLEWKTAISPRAPIPGSALLPDYATEGVTESFIKLFKSALIVNGFELSAEEVPYFERHAADFDRFDFNSVTMQHWRRLRAYTKLRDGLAQSTMSLLDLFKWANQPDDPSKLSAQIAAVTTWNQTDIDSLVQPAHFDLNRPEAFRNEVNLVKLQKAIKIARSIGIGIDRLFDWANPLSQFSVCHEIAGQVQAALRARFDQEDWEKAVKPLYDQLRQDQQQALVAYLLVQQDLIDWGVVDADSLFEFFLIDVQMCSCVNTSRIKQAISSVQSFIQRCLLGLEADYGVPSDVLDRDRWEWMQKYRVWEANRKVFLYPENWIKSELRDDKSVFYKELESELLQKDINTQTVEDALKSYLFKVDEVAHLRVVGLHLDEQNSTLHVFARTRNAPHFFFYRYFRTDEQNWYPWERVQVDIPSYDVENANGQIVDHGTYLAPVAWNGRLFLFFPNFAKKTQPVELTINTGSGDRTPTTKELSEMPFANEGSSEFWEIKIAWSEYRNKKWTQKQLSKDAVYSFDTIGKSQTSGGTTYKLQQRGLPSIATYRFVPRVITSVNREIVVDVYKQQTAVGAFHFQGSQIVRVNTAGIPAFTGANTDFHYRGTQLHSLQAQDGGQPSRFSAAPFSTDTAAGALTLREDASTQVNFLHPFVHDALATLTTEGLDALFSFYESSIPNDSATTPLKTDAFGGDAQPTVYHELKRAYSLYNWEAAFHAPMLLVDRLVAAQQFDQALEMCHRVLTPFAAGTAADPYWKFPPFREIDAENVLEKLFLGLQPNQPNGDINEWRDKPFQPHAVARRRPSAYMKWAAMKYVQIWIAYGDYYFRQNTLETIPLAIQCYVVASHVYGPPGQNIPKRGKIVPQTYRSLLDRWDAFGNAMVELELVFPFSNQTSLPIGVSNGVVGFADVFGFATTLYFCIPDNPQLRALRVTIDDRLFKIRHCEDIDGVFRQLPLFEPPIDPALLVQAAAQGLSLSSVLNDLNSPMPNFRFYYLLQKALEMCAELKTLGNAFLSAKEKGDAESLAQLRARHEASIHNLVMEVKKQQLDEATKALEALQQSRKGPVYRLQHHLKLIGEDLAKVPDAATDFGELPDQIEPPVDESGLKLIAFEKEEMDKASDAADWQIGIGVVETLASVFHALPSMYADGHPLGVGADVVWGFPNLANATSAVARGLKIHGDYLTYQSSRASRKGSFLRQLQDRVQQANVAGYEIKNIDKQVLTQQIRINISNQEIVNQQKQIDNSQEVEEFLRNKYSNQELYTWMENEVRGLYYQAYTLAYDLAKKAEKLFRFERGLSTSSFIQYGYWDASHDGLLSGERLYQGLKQLEAAYQEKRGHDFEISKTISLRQLDPMALLQLRETGSCEVSFPEVLFDMDYPGHYMRRIKSVALRVPCVLGTHTSLNCTLRLVEHKFRTNPLVNGKNDYPERTDGSEDRFTTVTVPVAAIAVSSLEDEAGVFELNFRDDRYLPFEGAGMISKWRIELPDTFRQFDYDTMTDVIFRFRYTSMDGGDKLKQPASGSVNDFIKSVEDLSQEQGLFAAFDLRNDFSDAWYTANHPAAGATERVMTISKLNEKLPLFTKGRPAKKIQATDVYLLAAADLSAAAFTATQGGNDITFTDGPAVGSMKSFVAKDVGSAMDDLEIHIADTKTAIDKIWLLERYVLT